MREAQELMEPFLAGYWSQRTRTNYAFILAGYLQWCAAQRIDALRDVAPGVVESWITVLRGRGYAPNTIAGRVSAVSAFYRWCVRGAAPRP
jgi:site-specific recombinase XerD